MKIHDAPDTNVVFQSSFSTQAVTGPMLAAANRGAPQQHRPAVPHEIDDASQACAALASPAVLRGSERATSTCPSGSRG
jgi:hypothetical protein